MLTHAVLFLEHIPFHFLAFNSWSSFRCQFESHFLRERTFSWYSAVSVVTALLFCRRLPFLFPLLISTYKTYDTVNSDDKVISNFKKFKSQMWFEIWHYCEINKMAQVSLCGWGNVCVEFRVRCPRPRSDLGGLVPPAGIRFLQWLLSENRVQDGSQLPVTIYLNSWSFTLLCLYLLFNLFTPCFIKPEAISVVFTGIAQSQAPSGFWITYLLIEWMNQKTSWTRTEFQKFCILFRSW